MGFFWIPLCFLELIMLYSIWFSFISACRYKKVVYLDSDVGQPEFTPPGFLSLTVVDKLTPGYFVKVLCSVDRFSCTERNKFFPNCSLS